MSGQVNLAVLPQMADLPFGEPAWRSACEAALEQRVDDPVLRDVQRACSEAGRWDGVYLLSVLARLETSVLIDAQDRIFLDWGTAGEVTLQPPVGARAPFKLWVHTHPRFASYWSATDTHSLALGATVVERAMVLGQSGPKTSRNFNPILIVKRDDCVVKSSIQPGLNLSGNNLEQGKHGVEDINHILREIKIPPLPSYRLSDRLLNSRKEPFSKRLAESGPLHHWTDEPPVPWDDWYAQHGLLTEVNA